MPTSGVTSWPLTASDVVTQALIELGVYAAGETPSGTDMDDGVTRLNGMLKSWDSDLFHETTDTVTVTGGTATVAAPADCRAISSVRHVVSATYNRQLGEWNRAEYYSIPNRATIGSPSVFYPERSTTGITLHVWPVPTADITLELDYCKITQTVTDPSETIDVPEEWQEMLIFGLASRMASMFGVTRIDPNTVSRIDARANELYRTLMDRARPESYYFEPDC